MAKYDFRRLIGLGVSWDDAQALRRISMTLGNWFEGECGNGNENGSWAIVRGRKVSGEFTHDDDGAPYMEHHHYLHGRGKDYTTHTRLPDRESGARKRLDKIMARYPALVSYIQGDPRGASLYIIPRDKVPPGSELSTCYSSFGVAVYK